jgi:hypothetical protein
MSECVQCQPACAQSLHRSCIAFLGLHKPLLTLLGQPRSDSAHLSAAPFKLCAPLCSPVQTLRPPPPAPRIYPQALLSHASGQPCLPACLLGGGMHGRRQVPNSAPDVWVACLWWINPGTPRTLQPCWGLAGWHSSHAGGRLLLPAWACSNHHGGRRLGASRLKPSVSGQPLS